MRKQNFFDKFPHRITQAVCLVLAAAILLSGMGAGTVTAYADEPMVLGNTQEDFTPVFRFAVTSDVHIRGKSSGVLNGYDQLADFYASAYGYSEAQSYNKLDGIFFIGDNTQTGSAEEQNYFFDYLNTYTKDGTYVRAAMGNHEFKATGKNYADPAGATKKFLEYSGYESEDIRFELGGYQFIMLSPDLYDKTNAKYFSEKKITWLEQELKAAAEATPDKPIFVMQHQPPRYTMNGSHGISGDADLTEVLSKYPQVIDFSGHTHYTMTDPRAIWQGSFTALNTASLCYLSLPMLDSDGNQTGAKATNNEGSWVSGSMDYAVRNAGMFYIVEADANHRVRVLIYNMFTHSLWGEPYILDSLDPKDFIYTDARAEQAVQPEYPSGSALRLHSNQYKNVKISIPQALCKDIVQSYRVEVYKGDTLIDTSYRLACTNYGEAAPERVPAFLTGLSPATKYTVKVYALSSYGLSSAPLNMEFKTSAGIQSIEADVLDVIFTPDGTAMNKADGMPLETIGAPQVTYDKELGQYVANFDGQDDAYSYRDISYWYDIIGTGFTLESQVWLDKTPTGANMNPLSNLQSAGIGFLCDTAGKVRFYNRTDTQDDYLIQKTTMTPGRWVHLLGTYDGSAMRFYVDGALVAENAISGSVTAPAPLAQMLCIGADSAVDTYANWFDGKVASAKLYSRALTQDEITEMYQWMDGGESATVCPDHSEVTAWTPVAAADWANGGAIAQGHYVLTENISLSKTLTVAQNTSVCINLNGYDITASGEAVEGEAYRVFENSGTLSILDSALSDGVISGGTAWIHGKTVDFSKGGNIYNASGAVFNLYDGIIYGGKVSTGANAEAGSMGGNIYGDTGSVINILGGAVLDGFATKGGSYTNVNYKIIYGGNISSYGTVNISGGTVSGGKLSLSYSNTSASRMLYLHGGNIAVLSGGKLNISGGTVSDGLITGTRTNASAAASAYGRGGNIFASGADVNISGGSMSGGTIALTAIGSATGTTVPAYAKAFGANIYITKGNMTITGGRISGGKIDSIAKANTDSTSTGKATVQAYGGNFYITDDAVVNMSGGTVTGGTVSHNSQAGTTTAYGGNFYVTGNGILNASGGTIFDGIGGARGGNILVCDEGTVNLTGEVVVTGGNATNGSNVSAQDSASATLNISGNAQLIAPKGKNSVYANANAKVNMYGGTVLGGLTMSATTASKQTAFKLYGGYVETLSKTDALPIGQVVLYNGKLGCDPANKATLGGCACLTDNGDGTYTVWHESAVDGSCATCGFDYESKQVVMLPGEHTLAQNGLCAVCGKPAAVTLFLDDGTRTSTGSADGLNLHLNTPGSYLRLNVSGLTVGIPGSKTATIDLNGNTAAVTGSGTLQGIDSANDTYAHSAGAVTVANTVTVSRETYAKGNCYIALEEGDKYAFHRLGMDITGMALRPGNVGVYYTGTFRGDTCVQENVAAYGVVFSLKGAPGLENGAFTADCAASSFTGFTDGSNATGTLLDGILKKSNTVLENKRNATIPIYGKAYVQLKDGTIVLGEGVNLSLRDLIFIADDDAIWQTQSQSAVNALAQMYKDYTAVMQDWNIPNLKAAAQGQRFIGRE